MVLTATWPSRNVGEALYSASLRFEVALSGLEAPSKRSAQLLWPPSSPSSWQAWASSHRLLLTEVVLERPFIDEPSLGGDAATELASDVADAGEPNEALCGTEAALAGQAYVEDRPRRAKLRSAVRSCCSHLVECDPIDAAPCIAPAEASAAMLITVTTAISAAHLIVPKEAAQAGIWM